MRKLIVGCGYLGRRVAVRWKDAGHDVFALTRSPNRAAELSAMGITPIVGDVCLTKTLSQLPPVETVLYSVGFDRNSGYTQRDVAVEGLRNVLNQVRCTCARFISISSTSVYGQSDGEWVDEASSCQPVQPGGACCLDAEMLLRQELLGPLSEEETKSSRSPDYAVLRLSGIYGQGRLLSRIESLRAGTPLTGQPDAWLNLIHVDDAATTVDLIEEALIQGDASSGETVLVSDDMPIRREDYYSRLAELAECPPPVFHSDEPSRRGSGGLNKRCSNRKLRGKFGARLVYPSIIEGLPHALGLVPSPSTESWAHPIG